jgi:hypothetical protein
MNQLTGLCRNQSANTSSQQNNAQFVSSMPGLNGANLGHSEFNPFKSNMHEREAFHNDGRGQMAKSHQISSIFAEIDVNHEESCDSLFTTLKAY